MRSNNIKCLPLSPRSRKIHLPYHVVRILTGGNPITPYKGDGDVVAINWCGEDYILNKKDFDFVMKISNEMFEEFILPERDMGKIFSIDYVLKLHNYAARRIAMNCDENGDRKKLGILMLRDNSGSGWWRMTNPAKYLDLEGYFVDVINYGLSFERCLDYEIIYVQRTHSWNEYHLLTRLKEAGKKIVYDLDDDLFSIPPSNPASNYIGIDEQLAARACMNIADVITTTTEVLRGRIEEEVGVEKDIRIIPNSLDSDDGWNSLNEIGSPDGNLRLFWQGGESHSEDWHECISAIDAMMQKYPNLILMVLGYLPPVLMERSKLPLYKGRIQYMGFSNAESYFELIKHIRADVGIAPLKDDLFNKSKSPIKYIEYSLIGIPTIASNVSPYSSVIEDGLNGYLCSENDWEQKLDELLSDADLRKSFVLNARDLVDDSFNIYDVIEDLEEALVGQD